MKNLFKLTVILLFVYSCKKDEPIIAFDGNITLTGKIVHDCAGNPVINRNVELYIVYGGWDGEIVDVQTDSNGNFNWSFKTKQSPLEIVIRPAGMGDVLTFDPKSHTNLGTIIANPTVNVVMKIKVNNPYSSMETLELKDFTSSSSYHKITGPFKDTIFQTAYNYSELSWPGTFEQKNTTFVQAIIYIYKGVKGNTSYEELKSEWVENRFKSCTGTIDTVLLEIN